MKLIFNIGYNFENTLFILTPDDRYSQEVTNSYSGGQRSGLVFFVMTCCKNKDLSYPLLAKYKKII